MNYEKLVWQHFLKIIPNMQNSKKCPLVSWNWVPKKFMVKWIPSHQLPELNPKNHSSATAPHIIPLTLSPTKQGKFEPPSSEPKHKKKGALKLFQRIFPKTLKNIKIKTHTPISISLQNHKPSLDDKTDISANIFKIAANSFAFSKNSYFYYSSSSKHNQSKVRGCLSSPNHSLQ